MMRFLIIIFCLIALAACSDDANRVHLVDQSDASILDAAGDVSTMVDTIDTPDTHDTPDAAQDADPPQVDASPDVEQIPDVIPDIDESEPELPGNEDVCECTAVGPCCDGCSFLGADTVCEGSEYQRAACSAPDACGNSIVLEERQTRCTGQSAECGEADWYAIEVFRQCEGFEKCRFTSDSEYAPSCQWVPECN